MNLSEVLEWKYGLVANTASSVEIFLSEIFKETAEKITFRNLITVASSEDEEDLYKYYAIPVDEISNLMIGNVPVSFNILQINADRHGLSYNPANIEMVITKWNNPNIPQPTKEQLETDFTEYEAHLESIAYKENRKKEYPAIEDQLDALWKVIDVSGVPEAEAIKADIEAVKAKHPKP
jgi:hypothetical protein